MLKKTWAIVLSLILILSACPMTSVFADTKPAAITEGFEGEESNARLTDVGTNPTTRAVVDGGRNSAKALEITDLTGYKALGFLEEDFNASTDIAVLAYDIQVSQKPTNLTDGKLVYLAGTTSGGNTSTINLTQKTESGEKKLYFCNQTGSTYYGEVEVGKWYRIYAANAGTSSTQAKIYNWAVNDEGVVVASNIRTGRTTNDKYSIVASAAGAPAVFGDGKILIDNVYYNSYAYTTYGPSVIESSIANGETNVSRATKSVNVTFDQPLGTVSATLTPAAGGTAITCTPTQNAMTYTFSWSDNLAADTLYTLDFTGSKNDKSVAVDSTGVITFNTAAATLADEVLRDDFEDTSKFKVGTDECSLYDSASSPTKPFVSRGHQGGFVADGYNGGSAVGVKYNQDCSTGTYATLASSMPYVFGDNNGVVVTYKMKIFNADVTEEDGVYFGGTNAWFGVTSQTSGRANPASRVVAAIDLDKDTGEHYIGASDCNSSDPNQAGKRGFYYTEDIWYNVTYAINKDGSSFVLTDIDTGNVLYKNINTASHSATSYPDGLYVSLAGLSDRIEKTGSPAVATGDTENGEGAAIVIDDISLWSIDNTKETHKLTSEASADENVVTIDFNQPTLVTADMLKVYKGTECNEEVEDAEFSIVYPNDVNFGKNIITVLGLEPGETYTLDYSEVTSAGGADFGGETVTQLIEISAPSVTMMTGADYSGNNASVNFWAKAGETSGRFIAAFYDGSTTKKLVAAAVSDEITFETGKNEITIPVTADVSNATSLVIYAWDGLSDITPLCAPSKTIVLK